MVRPRFYALVDYTGQLNRWHHSGGERDHRTGNTKYALLKDPCHCLCFSGKGMEGWLSRATGPDESEAPRERAAHRADRDGLHGCSKCFSTLLTSGRLMVFVPGRAGRTFGGVTAWVCQQSGATAGPHMVGLMRQRWYSDLMLRAHPCPSLPVYSCTVVNIQPSQRDRPPRLPVSCASAGAPTPACPRPPSPCRSPSAKQHTRMAQRGQGLALVAALLMLLGGAAAASAGEGAAAP